MRANGSAGLFASRTRSPAELATRQFGDQGPPRETEFALFKSASLKGSKPYPPNQSPLTAGCWRVSACLFMVLAMIKLSLRVTVDAGALLKAVLAILLLLTR